MIYITNPIQTSISLPNTLTAQLRDVEVVFDKHFTYNQLSPSSEWIIEHNLRKHPSVTVVDSGGNVVVGDVQHITENKLKVTFSSAFSGTAYLN